MAAGLLALGVRAKEYEDGLDIHGGPVQGGEVDGAGDHRCAMSFGVLGQAANAPVMVHGAGHINTSYPGFQQDMLALGGDLEMQTAYLGTGRADEQ
jgi:3-phosphoshikimate 1-carboxyvinyltransferase